MGTQLSKFGTAGVLPFATQPPLVAVSGKRVARCNVGPLSLQCMKIILPKPYHMPILPTCSQYGLLWMKSQSPSYSA